MPGRTPDATPPAPAAPTHVLHVASEVFPFSRSGGLGDVLDALPRELAGLGLRCTVLSPWYADLAGRPREVWRGRDGLRVGVLEGGGVRYLFLGLPPFERPGLYGPDDVWRFARWGRAVFPTLYALGIRPDVLHGHDWAAGLVVAHAHLYGLPTVFSVHNLQYQGRWNGAEAMPWTGLPPETYSPDGLEFYGDVNCMKAGLAYADVVTTVSPTYAQEVTTPAYGEGLEGVLLRRQYELALVGILNGLDDERWDPRTDPQVQPYADLAGKRANTAALRAEFQLDDKPLLVAVSRLALQKGMDLLVEALPKVVQDWNVIVLGGGDPLLEVALTGWAQHPRVRFASGMDEGLAHRLYAGGDAFVMPSRFEPCGLSQMIALRYGTLPVVRDTGGLRDTVPVDIGFRFSEASVPDLLASLETARATFDHPAEWRARAERGMTLDFSWGASARRYAEVYQGAIQRAGGSALPAMLPG